jgi:hypothetical protein
MDIPDPPPSPPKLKAYLKLLKEAAMTARPIAGRNTTLTETPGSGTIVNASDCDPCPES